MTTISIRVSEPRALSTTTITSALPVWTRVARWFQHSWCVINGGHFKVLHTEPDRLALRCVACGHTSPGWEVGAPRVARHLPADQQRVRARRAVAA